MNNLSKKYYDPYSEPMGDDYFPSLGRPSVVANEDDFDYALELVPDPEYRLVAKTLSEIVGFDELNFNVVDAYPQETSVSPTKPNNIDDNEFRISIGSELSDMVDISANTSAQASARTSIAGHDDGDMMADDDKRPLASQSLDSMNSKDSAVSYQDFIWKMGMMQKQKTWIDSVRRRSSLNFQSHFMLSDKVARDRFLVMLSSGVHVRRHQSHHIAEMVRLHSMNGCKTIEWSKPRPLDLMRQRQKDGQFSDGSTGAIYASAHDRETFDCCITICGCGDDLLIGNDPAPRPANGSPQRPTSPIPSHTNISMLSSSDESHYQGKGRCLHNLGFKHHGLFEDTDIVTIHPATKEDPTHPGMTGTETLRNSNDTYNAMLSFSIIYRRMLSSQGYETIDLECDNQETYFIMLRGFYMLRDDADARRKALLQHHHQQECDKKSSSIYHMISSCLPSSSSSGSLSSSDPISSLYDDKDDYGIFSVFLNGPKRADVSNMYPKQQQWLDTESKKVALPPAQFLGWNTAGTQIWARLAMAGLDVKPVYSWDLTRILLKIRCPQWRLEEVAEHMHLRLKNRDGTMRRFKVSRRDTFVSLGSDGTIFRSSERQQIIDFIIRSKIKDGGAELDENSSLGRKIVQRFPLHMESRLRDLQHKWVKFWKIEPPGQVSLPWSPLTTPISESLAKISSTMKMIYHGLLRQPLDHVAEYFGEDIAFYFAFNAFYTRWLIVPSLLGFIVFCFQIHDQHLDHWLCLPYAVAVMIWACFLLAYWRQKSSVFAYRWGVLDYEIEEKERPQFHAPYEYDDSTGEVHKVYPQYKRMLKYMMTIPIIIIISLSMLVIMATLFSTQDQLYSNYAHHEPLNYHPQFNIFFGVSYNNDMMTPSSSNTTSSNIVQTQIDQLRDPWGTHITTQDLVNSDFWIVTFLYPCLYGILVDIMALCFSSLAIYMNDYENHRTSSIYTNRLILKIFSFQFITVFTSLYYYAFISKRGESSYLRMSVTIFALMTVGQWYSAFMDIFIPALYHRIRRYHRIISIAKINRHVYRAREYIDHAIGWMGYHHNQPSSSSSMKPSSSYDAQTQVDKRALLLSQARSRVWEEAMMMRYSTFDDYTNLILQLGFVLLFSIVFPLAPLILLGNNLVLIRLKAIKICYFRQRPLAMKVSGMGVWEDLLQVMSAAGILTNCGIMAFTSSILSSSLIGVKLNDGSMILLLFAFEHMLLLFKYWLHVSIPRVPPAVLRAKNRDRQSAAHHNNNMGSSSSYDDKKNKNKNKRKSSTNNHHHSYISLPSYNHDDDDKMIHVHDDDIIHTSIPFQQQSSSFHDKMMHDDENYDDDRRLSASIFIKNIFQDDDDDHNNISYDDDHDTINYDDDDHHVPAHVRFSTAGDDVHIFTPARMSDDVSSSDDEDVSHDGPGIRSSYDNHHHHPYDGHNNISSYDDDDINDDDDDRSLSSAGSIDDEDAHRRQQQVWGEAAAIELQQQEEEAWRIKHEHDRIMLQHRIIDLQRRQDELKMKMMMDRTTSSSSSMISSSRSTSPQPSSSSSSSRPSLLQVIVDTVWGNNTEKRQTELAIAPLKQHHNHKDDHQLDDDDVEMRSVSPPRDSLALSSSPSKRIKKVKSHHLPSSSSMNTDPMIISLSSSSSSTSSPKQSSSIMSASSPTLSSSSSSSPKQSSSYVEHVHVGGNISINSDMYRQAQQRHHHHKPTSSSSSMNNDPFIISPSPTQPSSSSMEKRVGGNISINSDMYHQAQERHHHKQSSSRHHQPSSSSSRHHVPLQHHHHQQHHPTSSHPPIRRPIPSSSMTSSPAMMLSENNPRLANLPASSSSSSSLVETSSLRLRSAMKSPPSSSSSSSDMMKSPTRTSANTTGPYYSPASSSSRSPAKMYHTNISSSSSSSPRPVSGRVSNAINMLIAQDDDEHHHKVPSNMYIGANINPANLPDIAKKSSSASMRSPPATATSTGSQHHHAKKQR